MCEEKSETRCLLNKEENWFAKYSHKIGFIYIPFFNFRTIWHPALFLLGIGVVMAGALSGRRKL